MFEFTRSAGAWCFIPDFMTCYRKASYYAAAKERKNTNNIVYAFSVVLNFELGKKLLYPRT